MAEALGVPCVMSPYTLPCEREAMAPFEKGDLVVWATPVYAGRIPNKTLEFVKMRVRGEGVLALPIAVFGGRNYDFALAEMCRILQEGSMRPVAAAAMVARHTFSEILGKGRPSNGDLEQLESFCLSVVKNGPVGEMQLAQIPHYKEELTYYTPKKEDGGAANFLKAKPVVDTEGCRGCGSCAEVCPMGSVLMENGLPQFEGVCIKCMACVKQCPNGALRFENEDFLSHIRMLEKSCDSGVGNDFFG